MRYISIQSVRGFTLVEVLVAIAIFAVLSASGWMVFDHLIKNRERNTQHASQLQQLQFAYMQVLRDINQIAPIVGKVDSDIYPALKLDSQLLQFNKAGVFDPLQQGLDEFEQIEYRYDVSKKALVRYRNTYIYRPNIQNMQGDVILAPIDNVRFQVLDPGVYEQWPAQAVTDTDSTSYINAQIPLGIEVQFNYLGRDYRWVFATNVTSLANIENTPIENQGDQQGDKDES